MQFNYHNKLYFQLANQLAELVSQKFDTQVEIGDLYKLFVLPPNPKQGDLAFGCFILAKQLKQAPPAIAQSLAQDFKSDLVKSSQAAGPYLNFFLNPETCNQLILDEILTGEAFKKEIIKEAPKTIIEYSQPNTHKELHVGHMRNLCYGNALVRLYRYCGVDTIATTFPGDMGTHVAKCLWYYKKHNTQTPPENRKGAWLGTLYTAANNLLEEQRGSDKEETNRQELTAILHELLAEKGEYFELWKETREWSIELMQSVYDWADVKFDRWYWESEVDASSVAMAKKYYEQGIFVKDAGAIGIDLSDDKLGFCLLLKSDGTGLYATKDVELARKKFEEFNAKRSLYVVDNRQALHFKQVFKTLEKIGFEHAKDCHHLQYEMVELTDGAMSSRKGNIIALQDLIDRMVGTIKEQYLNKYQDEWSQEEIDNTANTIAAGAIKYGMNKIDSNKKIVFDMQDWLKLDGESGPYIQYVYARISSMLGKLSDVKPANFNHLTHEKESALINHLAKFNQTVQAALEKHATHMICQYVYQLAKLYNSFYADCSVSNAETAELKSARFGLSQAVATTVKEGMAILGIDVPNRM